MGQKTNPNAFRLVTTKKHFSTWYSAKDIYPRALQDDYFIRETVEKIFKDYFVLSNIKIFRCEGENQRVNINVSVLFPRTKEIYKKAVSYFESSKDPKTKNAFSALISKKTKFAPFISLLLERLSFELFTRLQKRGHYKIFFDFIKSPFEDASLIAKYIGSQLQKRIPFRRIMKHCLKKVSLTFIKGIKIELSGRLNGIEIARSEWKRQGKIPLHTLKAKIDYVKHEAYTVYGVIGIKIWLFIE